VHTHTHGLCSNVMEVRTLSWTDDKPIRWCNIHPSRSQIPTVMAMSITTDSLLPRLKLDCDVGYDAAMKGASVVVVGALGRPASPPPCASGILARLGPLLRCCLP